MSQASNMVKWCLNKAKKEVEDCKKQGLRIQHRGLSKAAPNAEKAKKHLNKAEHNLNAGANFRSLPQHSNSLFSLLKHFLVQKLP